MTTWKIRINFVLACIASAALAVFFCAEIIIVWRLAAAGIAAVVIGLYAGLWLPREIG